ncbi:Signal transduction histidine kinase [Actinoalloteichus cyanogriseus DSM 43889]|uniref:Signal transduction histidine kinase n=1 Tax=Actinoalloteichus caeruleus DSM 43889 TaxID=1120930 RepID=A0ABT1JEE4_ACTCY|nr:Signal transduction histidine kinase [Actinoalloteichus caeruleus DSM 43889]
MTTTHDLWQGRRPGPGSYDGRVRRLDPDTWSAIFGLVVCLTAGLPVLLTQLNGQEVTVGPLWLWWLVYLGFVTSLVASAMQSEEASRGSRWSLAGAVVLGCALMLLAPGAGWTQIVLVYVAAISCYIVPWRVTLAIIVLNTLVVLVAASQASQEMHNVLFTAMLYAFLQVGTALSATAHQRDIESRERLAVAHTELRAASAILAETTRGDERLRISRELHDLIGHQLTVLTLELEVAAHKSTPPALEHVVRARKVAGELLGDVRATVGELRRRAPDLRDTLDRIVRDLPQPLVTVRVDEDVRLDETRAAAVVRCAQEIITNTIRHADAKELWITVSSGENGEVRLVAQDDGRGSGDLVLGNGLRGMVERVEELGGRARFRSDNGFRVEAEVPAA